MLIKVPSVANLGLQTIKVDIEINLANKGLPGFEIVGLPDKAVDESKERVRTAIISSEVDFPAKKITVNTSPKNFSASFVTFPSDILAEIKGIKTVIEASDAMQTKIRSGTRKAA